MWAAGRNLHLLFAPKWLCKQSEWYAWRCCDEKVKTVWEMVSWFFVWSGLGLCERRVTGKAGELDWCVWGQVKVTAHSARWRSYTINIQGSFVKWNEQANEGMEAARQWCKTSWQPLPKTRVSTPGEMLWGIIHFTAGGLFYFSDEIGEREVGSLSPDGTAEAEVGRRGSSSFISLSLVPWKNKDERLNCTVCFYLQRSRISNCINLLLCFALSG